MQLRVRGHMLWSIRQTLALLILFMIGQGDAIAQRVDRYTGVVPSNCRGIPEVVNSCLANGSCMPATNNAFLVCLSNNGISWYPNGPISAPPAIPNYTPPPLATEQPNRDSDFAGRDIEVWHARVDMTSVSPCSRAKTYKDDFGITWPNGLEFAKQELIARIVVHVNSPSQILDSVGNQAKTCGIQAAAIAGLTAYSTTGTAAWPAFKATFYTCMKDTGFIKYFGGVDLTSGSHCDW